MDRPGSARQSQARGPILEICADSLKSVAAAISGHADQVELCAALAVGGLTPSIGLVHKAVDQCHAAGLKVRAMVRVRAGGFAYDEDELTQSIMEAVALIDAGIDGLVFGATRDEALDAYSLARFRDAARGRRTDIGLTLHRAIDLVADPIAATRQAIDLGFDQILSSGGGETAWEGRSTLAHMVRIAAGRCRIVAGSGVNPGTARALLNETRVGGLHGTARPSPHSHSTSDNANRFGFGTPLAPSDPAIVTQLRTIIDDKTIIGPIGPLRD